MTNKPSRPNAPLLLRLLTAALACLLGVVATSASGLAAPAGAQDIPTYADDSHAAVCPLHRGLTGQIGSTQSSTGVPTIGYAPGISDAAWRNAASQGVPILRSPGELVAYIREFG